LIYYVYIYGISPVFLKWKFEQNDKVIEVLSTKFSRHIPNSAQFCFIQEEEDVILISENHSMENALYWLDDIISENIPQESQIIFNRVKEYWSHLKALYENNTLDPKEVCLS